MKHFGILKNKGFEAMSPADQEALLLELGLYEVKHRIKISRNNIPVALVATNENRIVVPTKAVEEEFYGYLKAQFEQEIEDPYLEFFYVFNEEIYGLEEDEQHAIGLFYFKLYAELAKNHSVDFIRERKTDNGILLPETWGKLEALQAQQNSLKSRTARSDLLMLYLLGNQEAFKQTELNENVLLAEIVEFDAHLMVLRSLNRMFAFEEDPFVKQLNNVANKNVVELVELPRDSPLEGQKKIRKKKKERLSDQEAREFLLEIAFGVNIS